MITGRARTGRRLPPIIAAFLAGVVLAGTAVNAATPGAETTARSDPQQERTTEWLTAKVGEALGTEEPVTWVPTGSFATSPEVRVPRYPFEIDGRDTTDLALDAVRGEQVSAQVVAASAHPLKDLRAEVSDLRGPDGASLPGDAVQVRFVKYVPVMRSKTELDWSATIEEVTSDREVSGDRNPDVVGDALEERASIDVPAYAAQPVWFTFRIPQDAEPGAYQGTVKLRTADGSLADYPLDLQVAPVNVPEPSDYRFLLDVWMQPETIAADAGVKPWSPQHWKLMDRYFEDLASRGQKVVNTAIVDNPWHHEWPLGKIRAQTALPYQSLVGWQWDGTEFGFDFSRFDRYVEAARAAGLGDTIAAYSMLAFHSAEHLTYTDTRTGEEVYEEVELGDDRWRLAWGSFLRDFQRHLEDRGWLEDTWLSFDERPIETMSVVEEFVHETAPVFDDRIAVAGTVDTADVADNLSVGWKSLKDTTPEMIEERRKAGKLTTYYVYGVPPHPNTYSYSPSVEGRMLPWISAERRLDGLLRWSYNSWTADPFQEPVFLFTQGDEYLVYPGEGRPMSSIRWEQLREGIEDFELVTQVREGLDGGADPPALTEALELATRDLDGRQKDPADLAKARELVVQELLRQ